MLPHSASCVVQRFGQLVEILRVGYIELDVADHAGECLPRIGRRLAPARIFGDAFAVMLGEGGIAAIRTIHGQQLKSLRQMPIEKEVEQGRDHQAPGEVAAGAEQDKQGVAWVSRCFHGFFSLTF